MFPILGWKIWHKRNAVYWEERHTPPSSVVVDVVGYLNECLAAKTPQRTTSNLSPCERWHSPIAGLVKVNVYVSQFVSARVMGAEMVFRDGHEIFIAARSKIYLETILAEETKIIFVHKVLSWKELGINLFQSNWKRMLN